MLPKKTSNEAQKPLIGTIGAILIALSVVLAAALIAVSILYKGKKNPTKSVEEKSTKSEKQKKVSQSSIEDEKKALRTKLINGEIDQETYDREIGKLF